MTRAELMQQWKNGNAVYDSYESDGVNVRAYGNTVVATGRITRKGHSKVQNKDLSGQFRFTRVYVKQHGQWQMVASQVTRITQQ